MNKLQAQILFYMTDFITLENLILNLSRDGVSIDNRTLRNEIRNLVMEGYPVISECINRKKGYKIEKDINKIINNAERLKKRGIKIIERAEKLKQIALKMQQPNLFSILLNEV